MYAEGKRHDEKTFSARRKNFSRRATSRKKLRFFAVAAVKRKGKCWVSDSESHLAAVRGH